MILTVTMNPSIDFAYHSDHFSLGKTNRFEAPVRSVGGKGINAGRTAALAGSEVIQTGFLAGDTGTLIKKYLTEEQLFQLDMDTTDGETRNAIAIMHDHDTHTEIIENGPEISDEEVSYLLEKIRNYSVTKKLKLICISGSINSKNQKIYLEMLHFIRTEISAEIPVFMDVSGEQLLSLLKSKEVKPTFIKPNIHELSEIVGKEIPTKALAKQQLMNPFFDGIDYVMISCGKEGAICKSENNFYDIQIPEIPVINTTGSGDATVGGFAYAIENSFSLEDSLRFAMACGMSNAQHGEVGFINKEDVDLFADQVVVKTF